MTPSSEWIIEEAEKWSLDCDPFLMCTRAASLTTGEGSREARELLPGHTSICWSIFVRKARRAGNRCLPASTHLGFGAQWCPGFTPIWTFG